MKKRVTGFVAILSMALIGCTKEEATITNGTNDAYTAIIEVEQTRTNLGSDGSTLWSDEDAVSIFKSSGYHQKYVVEAGGSSTATLKYGGVSSQHGVNMAHNYAVYPYSANHTIDAQEMLTLDLSTLAEQSYVEGSFDNQKAAMTAKSDDKNLSFFNVLSTLRIKLCSDVPGDYSIKSITLTSATQPLNGVATVDMSMDKQPAVFTSAAVESRSTKLTCVEAVMLNEPCDETTGGHDFYILLPATVFPANDLTIKIEGEDVNGQDLVYEATYPLELALVRSGITTIHHNFEAADWVGNIEPTREVATADELVAAFDDMANISVIELTDNIDLSNIDWSPIGTADAPFRSILDGNGYTISNLTIADADYAAFIAYADEGVAIRDITFENVDITSTKYAAGVVCVANADGLTIENVKVTGTITATSYAAGIVHNADNVVIKNCENGADITAGRAGGIASWITAGSYLENVKNTGDIVGATGASGIAHAFAGTIKNAVNEGAITSNGTEPAAGIAGVQKAASTYEYCFNYGNVRSVADNPNSSAAGILGHTPGSAATLNYCANYGDITAEQSYAAGIAYSLYGSVMANYCYNSGAVDGADGAGGIAPKAQYGSNDKANYCLNAGAVTSSGGLVYQASTINTSCYYYNVDELLNVSDNTPATADDALAALNGGADNDFFEIFGGKITVNN